MKTKKTQQIKIKKNSKYWKQIDELSFDVKNLYNLGNYIIRQEFIKTSKDKEAGIIEEAHWINYYELDPILQNSEQYKKIGSQIAQQTLKLLDKNWKSFFKSIKDYSKHKEKYKGRPKMPGYLNKENGRYVIGLKNTQVKNIDGYVYFAWKPFKNMNNYFKTIRDERIFSVRIVPRLPDYILELIYEVEIPEPNQITTNIAGIDLGVNNLMTITTNCDIPPIVINGKPLKAMNSYYNKKKATLQSELMLKTGNHYSKRIQSLTTKRNSKIDDYIHKASKYLVDWCVDNNIDTLVCGHNDGWKQESDIGKINNQNFVSIPHSSLMQKIKYKCEDKGIKYIEVDEGYTSGTSFLDGEEPVKENYDKSRRVTRGLFVSNEGVEINADVNGSYQIIKKAFPEAFADGIQDVGLHPVIINL